MTAAATSGNRQETLDVFASSARRLASVEPLTRNDGFQLFHGMVQHIVDENIAIFVVVLNLYPGLFEAALDHLFRDAALCPAAVAPAGFQRLRRGRGAGQGD